MQGLLFNQNWILQGYKLDLLILSVQQEKKQKKQGLPLFRQGQLQLIQPLRTSISRGQKLLWEMQERKPKQVDHHGSAT